VERAKSGALLRVATVAEPGFALRVGMAKGVRLKMSAPTQDQASEDSHSESIPLPG